MTPRKASFMLAALALASAVPASAVTYVGTRTIGTGSAQLSITTDDTLGVLTAANITSWSVELSNGTDTATLTSPGDMELVGNALSATATELLFDFDLATAAILTFRTAGNRPAYCAIASVYSCGAAEDGTEGVFFSPDVYVSRSGVQVLATAVAVPEPSTWAMMIAGFGLAGGALRQRRTVFAAA